MSKVDEDLKNKSVPELQEMVMRYRRAFAYESNFTGNERCWMTWVEADSGLKLRAIDLPPKIFISNCFKYYLRNIPKRRVRWRKKLLEAARIVREILSK